MRYIISILLFFIFLSCNVSNNKEVDVVQHNDTSEQIKSEEESIHGSNVIKHACALIVRPTSRKIDSLKKAFEEDFYTIADDNQFYISTATDYLDSNKVKIIQVESKGIVTFQLPNGQTEVYNLNESLWEVLLFNGKTLPIEADLTNFKENCDRYFELH